VFDTRSRRAVVISQVVAVLVAALSQFLIHPHSARASIPAKRPVVLRGRTIVETSGNSAISVNLPRTTILAGGGFTPRLSGGGRIIGFVLTKTEGITEIGTGPTLYGFFANRCTKAGCPPYRKPSIYFIESSNLPKGAPRLPAGDYNLYLVGDGTSPTYEFLIGSLAGTTRISATAPANFEIDSIEPGTLSEPAGRTIFSGGSFDEAKGAGLSFFGMWVTGEDHISTTYGICTYESSSSAPPEPLAFAPSCPGGEGADGTTQPHLPEDGGLILSYSEMRLVDGLGGWYATSSRVGSAGAVALRLHF
jgi:hypothetical protein